MDFTNAPLPGLRKENEPSMTPRIANAIEHRPTVMVGAEAVCAKQARNGRPDTGTGGPHS